MDELFCPALSRDTAGARVWRGGLPLLLLLGLVALANLAWMLMDLAPPPHPTDRDLRNTRCLVTSDRSGAPVSCDYPPLFRAMGAAVVGLTGVPMAARWVMLPFVAVYVASLWWIGLRWGGRWSALAVAGAGSGMLGMASALRFYSIDAAAGAMVTLCFALLLWSDGYRLRLQCLALGLCLGLAMLCKWSAAWMLLAPLLLAALPALRGRDSWPWVVATVGVAGWQVWLLLAQAASLTAGGTAFLWAWAVLLASVLWFGRRRSRWSAGMGVASVAALAWIVCGWWYLENLPRLLSKYDADMAITVQRWASTSWLDSPYLRQALADSVFAGFWSVDLYLAIGILWGLARSSLRPPTALALAGLAGPLAFYWWHGHGAGWQYSLGLEAYIAPLAFGWIGFPCRGRGVVLPVTLALAALQALWWVPGLSRCLSGLPLIVHLNGRMAQVRQLRVTPPPVPWGFPLDEVFSELGGEPRFLVVMARPEDHGYLGLGPDLSSVAALGSSVQVVVRMEARDGLFTGYGSPPKPLEEELASGSDLASLRHVLLVGSCDDSWVIGLGSRLQGFEMVRQWSIPLDRPEGWGEVARALAVDRIASGRPDRLLWRLYVRRTVTPG